MSEQWEWRVERLDCEFDELCERMRDFDVAMERMDRALLQLRDDLSAVQAGLQRCGRCGQLIRYTRFDGPARG